MKYIKLYLIVLLLVVLSSCGKEEAVLTGKLKGTYINPPALYYLYICPAENTTIKNTGNLPLDNKGTFTCVLNFGNYVLKGCGANSAGLLSKGFQIKAGETTEINLE